MRGGRCHGRAFRTGKDLLEVQTNIPDIAAALFSVLPKAPLENWLNAFPCESRSSYVTPNSSRSVLLTKMIFAVIDT